MQQLEYIFNSQANEDVIGLNRALNVYIKNYHLKGNDDQDKQTVEILRKVQRQSIINYEAH